ncbi:hypothetical protein BDN67DRAFT_1038918 [Paxillus ammoniavirescens]|nr:hypothetical protein BDN67DRAFT_1038918 [Paxillus ammoniavirescens]
MGHCGAFQCRVMEPKVLERKMIAFPIHIQSTCCCWPYTDPNVVACQPHHAVAIGVTHICACQIVGGIEVTDAQVNLNITDGRVLSFGDYFFPGRVPTRHAEAFVHPHVNYRAQLSSAFSSQRTLLHSPSATQSHMGSHDHAKFRRGFATLEHFHSSNCANLSSVLDKAEEHARKMGMTPETHLLGDHSTLGMSSNNVPGAVSEGKARLVWVQVPSENGVQLESMHRASSTSADLFRCLYANREVKLEHNCYEKTVTASLPHRIVSVSVVDWASDSPIPFPVATEVGERLPRLGACVPPGPNFDTMSSAPGLGRGPRLGKGLAGKTSKKGCHGKEEAAEAYAPTQVLESNSRGFPLGCQRPCGGRPEENREARSDRCFWVVQQRLIGTHNFLKTLLPPTPNADGFLPPNYFYRPQTFNSLTGHANPLVLKHGSMLLMQLVLNGTKLQPCAPGFFDARDARDAIIQTDEILTGVENAGLGVSATVVGITPWGGGVRQDGSKVPPNCGYTRPAPKPEPSLKPKSTPGNPDENCRHLLPTWSMRQIRSRVTR